MVKASRRSGFGAAGLANRTRDRSSRACGIRYVMASELIVCSSASMKDGEQRGET